jgi:hypothetical protein
MLRFPTSILFAIAILLTSASAVLADDAVSNQLYSAAEAQIHEEFDRILVSGEAWRAEQRKAGKTVSADIVDATRALQSILYNKAVMLTLCAEHTIKVAKGNDDVDVLYRECVNEGLKEIGRGFKLSDYISSMDKRKLARCEANARDFENEGRFAPYSFLAHSGGPALYKMKRMNDCVLEAF